MTGRDILKEIFEITPNKGDYTQQFLNIDASGRFGLRQHMLIILKLCQALDETQEKLDKLTTPPAQSQGAEASPTTTEPVVGSGTDLPVPSGS